MSEPVKFTEEELSKVKLLQNDYLDIQNKLGQEKDFLDKITKKYGVGTLNPETGEFTANQS